MHDLIFAVAFVAMVASPAMVAAIGGRKDFEPGPRVSSHRHPTSIEVRPVAPPVRPRSATRAATPSRRHTLVDGPTLPMHNARGMANR